MVKEAAIENSLARALAPEDIVSGQFVMVLNEQHQYPCGRCNEQGDPEYVVVEVALRPDSTRMPRMVVGVCLPYLLVENQSGKKELIDIRSSKLVQVPDAFAFAAL